MIRKLLGGTGALAATLFTATAALARRRLDGDAALALPVRQQGLDRGGRHAQRTGQLVQRSQPAGLQGFAQGNQHEHLPQPQPPQPSAVASSGAMPRWPIWRNTSKASAAQTNTAAIQPPASPGCVARRLVW